MYWCVAGPRLWEVVTCGHVLAGLFEQRGEVQRAGGRADDRDDGGGRRERGGCRSDKQRVRWRGGVGGADDEGG